MSPQQDNPNTQPIESSDYRKQIPRSQIYKTKIRRHVIATYVGTYLYLMYQLLVEWVVYQQKKILVGTLPGKQY